MKKQKNTIMILLSLILIMSLWLMVGCDKNTTEETKTTDTTNTLEKETEKDEVNTEEAEPEEEVEISGVVSVWTWEPYENQELVINDFYKSYPEIEVVFTTVDSADMPMKIQTTLASNAEMPDVVWSEISQRGKMLSFDCWEDLSQAPYNVIEEDLLAFMVPLSTTPSGKLVGLEVAPPVTGLAYKRDMAIEYFGTDDPIELAAMFPTWDSFIEAGKEVLAKSNGEIYMFSAVDEIYQILLGQHPEPFIVDGTLNLNVAFTPIFDQLLEFKEAGIVDIIDTWTPAWNSTFSEKTNIFNYCPSWAPTWIFKAMASEETSGNWGLMVPPEGGCLVGGTNVLIPEKAENKLGAFAYIQWNYLSMEGAISNRDHLDYFSVYKPVYNDPDFYSAEDAFFGGQDILQFFAQTIMPNMAESRPVDQYDIEVNEAATLAIKTISASDGTNVTSEQLIDEMTVEIHNKVPDLN